MITMYFTKPLWVDLTRVNVPKNASTEWILVVNFRNTMQCGHIKITIMKLSWNFNRNPFGTITFMGLMDKKVQSWSQYCNSTGRSNVISKVTKWMSQIPGTPVSAGTQRQRFHKVQRRHRLLSSAPWEEEEGQTGILRANIDVALGFIGLSASSDFYLHVPLWT